MIKNSKDFFDQSLDEIKLLQYINAHGDADEHNVLKLIDFFYCKEHLFIVSELLRYVYTDIKTKTPFFLFHFFQKKILSNLKMNMKTNIITSMKTNIITNMITYVNTNTNA